MTLSIKMYKDLLLDLVHSVGHLDDNLIRAFVRASDVGRQAQGKMGQTIAVLAHVATFLQIEKLGSFQTVAQMGN